MMMDSADPATPAWSSTVRFVALTTRPGAAAVVSTLAV
jgi:hypothetical protein